MNNYSYALIVAAICYCPASAAVSEALVAAFTDNAGAVVVDSPEDEIPPTDRCPVSPLVVRERPIVVEVAQ